MLALLLACRSGVIHYATGTDDLRTATYATAVDDVYEDLRLMVVLLANSDLDCDRIPALTDAPEDIADVTQLAAFTRENARVVVLYLYKYESSSWADDYEVVGEHNGKNVTTDHGVASAAYLGVNEAVLTDEDGLERFYMPGSNPGDCTLVPDVPVPGEVVITRASGHMKGTFSLDSIDVSGEFDAEECTSNPNFVNTFKSLGLIENELTTCLDGDTPTPTGDAD